MLVPSENHVLEEARQNKRIIDRSTRTVERERVKLQNTEKKMLNEIKALAKQNKHVSAVARQVSFRVQPRS